MNLAANTVGENVLDIRFKFAKETKNTIRYETEKDGEAVTTLYVQKSTFDHLEGGGFPEYVDVTLNF